jgi:hypothetical protein
VKFPRLTLCAIAAVALLAGCGKSSDPTSALPDNDGTPTLDNTPPPVPSGINVVSDINGRAQLVWDASPASDVSGYQIFVYDPSPDRESSYTMLYDTDNGTTTYNLDPASTSTSRYFRLRATDTSGNASAMSEAVMANLGPVIPVGGDPENPPFPTMEP